MKAVWVLLPKAMPSVDMSCAQILCDLLFLLHINRTMVGALSPPGWGEPTRVKNLGL
jgi:hypothetical protein